MSSVLSLEHQEVVSLPYGTERRKKRELKAHYSLSLVAQYKVAPRRILPTRSEQHKATMGQWLVLGPRPFSS